MLLGDEGELHLWQHRWGAAQTPGLATGGTHKTQSPPPKVKLRHTPAAFEQ
jgi:hypothetical protein